MTTPRDTIYQALFDLLVANTQWQYGGQGSPKGFAETNRRVKLWGDPQIKPSMFMAEHEEYTEQKTGLPYKRSFKVKLIIYQDTAQAPGVAGSQENDRILDAVEAALIPTDGQQRQTLGGIVHHCFVEGNTFKDPGDLDGQGMMVVPITMLVP